MIIDKNRNNTFPSSSFDNKWQQIKNNNGTKMNDTFAKNITEMQHTNPANTKDMNERALAMLQQRYQKKNISIDELNRRCNSLNRK